MTLAKDLLAYEKDRTQPWMQHAHATAVALMRQPVLIEDPQSRRSCFPIPVAFRDLSLELSCRRQP